ncbi:DUF3244 domain-containing protein [uncultured Bacteroides sp.]|jgi:Protein of unknown function (DUF3244).|uniref:DUF3244 domain-containing protein n=2 Tax=uncultured Bacteroides sp. TaxID=162156 RepID=UPI0025E8E63A|nr:DUF3244 domain-containing protein [uncultured Bacteroides sp.]
MKRLLFILISLLAWGGSVYAQSSNIVMEIALYKDIKNDNNVDPEDMPVTRSPIFLPVYAYLYNKVVTVDFQATFSAVTVNVVSDVTGETVYSELLVNPTNVSIDLNGADSGDYRLEIISDEIALEGYFPL